MCRERYRACLTPALLVNRDVFGKAKSERAALAIAPSPDARARLPISSHGYSANRISGSQANTPHRAISERQAARPRRDPVFPPRRLLRDVLRGRRSRRARARHPAHLAQQGRRAAVRRALPFRGTVHRQAAEGGPQGRDLRARHARPQNAEADAAPNRARDHARHGRRGDGADRGREELPGRGDRRARGSGSRWRRSTSRPANSSRRRCARPRRCARKSRESRRAKS